MDHFLEKYRIRPEDVDVKQLVDVFISEMEKGLEGKDSSLRMIPTYIEADNEFRTGIPVTAIDAGGTNFRTAKVMFTGDGRLEMSDPVIEKMPGLDGEISKDDFFRVIAGYVRDLADETESIGFCFSYPTEILPDKDGRLLQFCKEVQAPGVVGELVGENLLNALDMPDKPIVLLNDTVATLLAGKSAAFEKTYDSYIGFILGTGTNTCYIESNRNIRKNRDLDPAKSQIINIESGNFGKAPRTEIDLKFDGSTSNPGQYSFEKMFSGGYFGGLALSALKAAADEGCLSIDSEKKLRALGDITTGDVNRYVTGSDSDRGPLKQCLIREEDEAAATQLITSLIGRAARLVTANLAAVLLRTGKGTDPEKPVLITVEGTAYYRLHGLKSQVESGLKEFLTGNRKRFYEFTYVDQSSLVGAALAALIEE